jgi:C4-dicarboxylate-binding protein DctP
MRVFALLLLAVLLGVPAAGPARAEEEVLLRVSLQDSIDNPLNDSLLEFKESVEERTKGAVKVQIFDNSKFYNDYQVPNAVGSGAIEMGLAPLGQYENEVPAAGVFLQPFLFNFDEIIRAAAQPGSEIRTIIDNEILSVTGARVLWWQRYGSPVLLSKSEPMLSPSAVEGHNISTYDALTGEIVNLCGGKAHVIADVKQAEAFDQKLVDANLTKISNIKEQELWSRARFLTRIRLSEIIYAVIINEQIWQALTPAQQEIIAEEAQKVEMRIWSRFAGIENASYTFAAGKGMEIKELSADDVVAWRVCSSQILESYMSKAGEIGSQLMTAYARLRMAPCCNKAANQDVVR